MNKLRIKKSYVNRREKNKMGSFYLDIETTGLRPEKSQILTIQFQELDRYTGEAKRELIILKAWESSEKEIIEEFIKLSKINDDWKWNFIPHGYNLEFEHNFLMKRSEFYNLPKINIFGRPFVDLCHVGVLMNNGEFKGSGLDKISRKQGSGFDIIEMYCFEAYDQIEEYIKQEAKAYIEFYAWLRKRMPELLKQFNEEMS